MPAQADGSGIGCAAAPLAAAGAEQRAIVREVPVHGQPLDTGALGDRADRRAQPAELPWSSTVASTMRCRVSAWLRARCLSSYFLVI